MRCYLCILMVAADFVLIILHFSPEHIYSAHHNPHSVHTHCLVHRCTLTAQIHTCASESNVALVTSALKGVILGLLARQPSAARHRHAHTSHLAQHILLALLPRAPSLLNRLKLYFTAQFSSVCHHTVNKLLAYLVLLFLEAELVQDFHSWLADLKLELKECSSHSGDIAILGARLQRLKVLYIILLYSTCYGTGVGALW